ncbi:MAG: PAS domain-containing protein [bacterium]|nr:PAS domain-containing protein [bacterium]
MIRFVKKILLLMLILAPIIAVPAAKNKSTHADNHSPEPAPETLVLDSTGKEYSLKPYLEILEDPEDSLTIEEIRKPGTAKRFEPGKTKSLTYEFSTTGFWLRFRVHNSSNRDETWLLELDYPHINIFELYAFDSSGNLTTKKTGDSLPFSQREYQYRKFIFELPLHEKETQQIYLHYGGASFKQLLVTMRSQKAFTEKVMEEKYAFGIYYGILLVMIFYNFSLFLSTRDKSYLFYVIYIISYAFVQMSYNGLAYRYLWPGFPWWHNLSTPVLIGFTAMWMTLFSQSFLQLKKYAPTMNKILFSLVPFSIFLMLYSLLGNYIIAIKLGMILMVISSPTIMIAGLLCMKKGYLPARFFLIAWVSFLCGILLLALNKLNIIPSVFITEYGIQIGSALEVTLLSIALADRINLTNREKKLAQAEVIKAQEKYRRIVEGSHDIFFSLDEHWNLLSANKAIEEQLKILPEAVETINFFDLIYEEPNGINVGKELVREKLEQFAQERSPIKFRANFISPIISEPKEVEVTLEYIDTNGRSEILGKASSALEDTLLKYFVFEKQKFSIGNYLLTAEEITQRITRNLVKYMQPKKVGLLRVGLREIIINAIEHGNLNITFNDKSRALMNNNYFDFIASRRSDPRYGDKQVKIEYSIDSEKVIYTISDEGKGFDHETVLNAKISLKNDEVLAHGRGIMMTKDIFDKIEYNDIGNEVLLVKYF